MSRASTEESQPVEAGSLLPRPASVPPPLNDTLRMIELLSDVMGQSPERVRQILLQDEHDHGGIFREAFRRSGLRPHVWSEGLARFYEETDVYLYGAVMWNRRPAKVQMRQWIGERLARDGRLLDVLTVGDGPGFDSQYLAHWGHRVTYSEISPKCMNFARRMFATAPVPVQIAEGVQRVPSASQDVVLCLDVLEHLPDPGWMIGEIVRCLRPGGRFIVHAPFFFVSPVNPTHLAANRRYSGDWRNLYGRHGLRPIDGRFFWDPLVLMKIAADAPAAKMPRLKRLLLGLGGLLLAVGRYWNGPHNFIAHRMVFARDERWMKEFAAAGAERAGIPRQDAASER